MRLPAPSASASASHSHSHSHSLSAHPSLSLSKETVLAHLAAQGFQPTALPEGMLDEFMAEMETVYKEERLRREIRREGERWEAWEVGGERSVEGIQRNGNANGNARGVKWRVEQEEEEEGVKVLPVRPRGKADVIRTGTTHPPTRAQNPKPHPQRIRAPASRTTTSTLRSTSTTSTSTSAHHHPQPQRPPPREQPSSILTASQLPPADPATYQMTIIEQLAALDLSRVKATVAKQRERERGGGRGYAPRGQTRNDHGEEEYDATYDDDARTGETGEESRDEDEEYTREYASGEEATGDEEAVYDDDDEEEDVDEESSYITTPTFTTVAEESRYPRYRTGFIYVNPNPAPPRKHDPVARFHQHRARWARDEFLQRLGPWTWSVRNGERGPMRHGGCSSAVSSMSNTVGGGFGGNAARRVGGMVTAAPGARGGAGPGKKREVRSRYAVNEYVVPTAKKRNDIIWDTRNRMAYMR
ncbi:uncharacterized protein EV422DRAFT_103603 [Fimicolochytrium jonesii]|uniref:uncharacterized protein n=1 Tax=Fimicolochytrium jonesii TaxID=1396493 RepID=UPI0022FDC8B5|nr:uncharacterized protein EV422DRAFT_103603 [Fimicolochytrium jonesii]KAI8819693.1 hypothetical protein EV422DRAFT_103603 [Fimicolochytrium jonesii]